MAFTTIPNVRLWNALYGKQEFTTGRVWFLLLLSLFLFFFWKKKGSCFAWVGFPIGERRRSSVRSACLGVFPCALLRFVWLNVCFANSLLNHGAFSYAFQFATLHRFGRKSEGEKGLERCAVWCKLKNLLFASRSYFSENLKIWRKHVVSLVKYRSMEKTLHIVQIRSVPRPFGCLHVLDGHED